MIALFGDAPKPKGLGLLPPAFPPFLIGDPNHGSIDDFGNPKNDLLDLRR
jgi:hypothetical protein